MIISDPNAAPIQAIFLRAHLRLLNAGMKHSRLRGTDILRHASRITGNIYKRGQYAIAIADLTKVIEAQRD